MFEKLQQRIGEEVFVKYWKDGKIYFYEGILSSVVDYKYILLDKRNFLLFLAKNGAIASIICDDEVIYHSKYDEVEYTVIDDDNNEELDRRELEIFDENFRKIKEEFSYEHLSNLGSKVINKKLNANWEKYLKEDEVNGFVEAKKVLGIALLVKNGNSFYEALSQAFAGDVSYSREFIERVVDRILYFFGSRIYDYTDYAIYSLHHAAMHTREEKLNMKKLISGQNVNVYLD